MEKFRLTNDDIRLLKLVMKAGVGRTEHAKKIYGDKTNKWQKRLVKLSKRGYIERGGGYFQLTFKGMHKLVREIRKRGEKAEPLKLLRIRKWERPRRAVMTDILMELSESSGWDFQFGIDLKREQGMDKRSRIIGTVGYGSEVYAVYHMPQKKPMPITVTSYANEIIELPLRNIKKVLLVYEYEEAAEQFVRRLASEKMIPGKTLEDLIMLPARDAVPRFKGYLEWKAGGRISAYMTGLSPLPASSHADYRWGEYDVVDLLVDRPLKRIHLNAFYSSPVWQYGYPVVILCVESNYTSLVEVYPMAGFVVFSDDLGTIKHKKAPEPVNVAR